MAFEGLTDKLQNAFKKLSGKGKLSEADVKAAMREVRMALLEADVNFTVVKDFIKKVTERAVGQEILSSLTPAQQVIKIVNDELTQLMGGTNAKLTYSPQPPTIYMLCGLQGAGKTTMVKLLMRFYDVSEGAILLDGYDVRQFARNDLRDMFGMVLQDTWLYNGTILENIRYGRLAASDEDVLAAAKAAQVDHFVRTLSQGYDTVLNEEASNISQGQKQLLTIARAILADPKIMILDEATSSVDTRTEERIQKGMDESMKGRTSFVIAHRLSTIRNADVIAVLREGTVAECGTHDELMRRGGYYSELYRAQFDAAQDAG